MFSNKKKILITGGAGFLGSHLCDKLISDENFVFCMDNLSTGSKHNISHLIKKKNFKFIDQSINDKIESIQTCNINSNNGITTINC